MSAGLSLGGSRRTPLDAPGPTRRVVGALAGILAACDTLTGTSLDAGTRHHQTAALNRVGRGPVDHRERAGLVERALGLLDLKAQSVAATTGGSSLPVYRVTDEAGRAFALRVGPQGASVTLDREVRNLRQAAAIGIPCPQVLARVDDDQVSALLTTWEAGVPLLEAALVDSGQVGPLSYAAGGLQARLHREGLAAISADLDAGWARPHSPAEDHALRACPDDGPSTLLHLDFHPLNILIDQGALTAVLDWVNAGIGDARRDVARTISILALDGAEMEGPIGRMADKMLIAWLRGYQAEGGELTAMKPYVVWAGLATIRDLSGKRSVDQLQRMIARVNAWRIGGEQIDDLDW